MTNEDDLLAGGLVPAPKPAIAAPQRTRTLSPPEIADNLRTAGWGEEHIPTMTAIAMAESKGNPTAHNPKYPDDSYGLLQVNRLAHPQYSPDQLRDPVGNAKAALDVFNREGLRAWSTYTNGAYKRHLNQTTSLATKDILAGGLVSSPETQAPSGPPVSPDVAELAATVAPPAQPTPLVAPGAETPPASTQPPVVRVPRPRRNVHARIQDITEMAIAGVDGNAPSIGDLRQQDEQEVMRQQRIRQQVQAEQQSAARAMRTAPMSAEARQYDPRKDINAEVLSRLTSEHATEADQARLHAEQQKRISEFTDADKSEISDFVNHLKGSSDTYSAIRTGTRTIGSSMLYKLAGLTDIANAIQKPVTGRDSWIPEYLKRKALAGELSVEEAKKDLRPSKYRKLVEFLTTSTLGLAEIAATPGGPVSKFAGLAGTEALGRGENLGNVAKHTAEGAAVGALFEGAGREFAPAADASRAGKLIAAGQQAGTVGAGTLALTGSPQEALSNALFAGGPTALHAFKRPGAVPMADHSDTVEYPAEGPVQLPTDRQVVPERAGTIAAQIDAMVNKRGNRLAVLIPPGEHGPTKIPRGYVTTRTEAGLIIHAKEVSPEKIRAIVSEGDTWALLGHQNPDTPDTPKRAVVAYAGRDTMAHGHLVKAGEELMTSYVNEGGEAAAIEELKQQFAPYKPVLQVGGNETAQAAVEQRAQQVEPASQPMAPEATTAAAPTEVPLVEPQTEKPSDKFTALSNQDLETYIQNARAKGEKRLARLQAPIPKGTARTARQARPRIIERSQARIEARVAEAQAELDRRRGGSDKTPSFEQWLESEAGGAAGGTRPETLSPEERATYQKQYDQQFYPKPHHSLFQARRQGRFREGKVERPIAPEIAAQLTRTPETQPSDKASTAPWEGPTSDKLFATSAAPPAVEPTADEAKAAQEPVVPVRPMERQNALRSYLGNKITMARAGAFNIIPESWKGKWNRVVDVFGGSGVHGWQLGKALGMPVHYNELDPDVHAFQQLASTNEGQEKIRKVWSPIADEINAMVREQPQGGAEIHRRVDEWWRQTQERLRKAATPEERGVRVLLENTLGTMGNEQRIIGERGGDHKWNENIVSQMGDVAALLERHRLNSQAWQSTSNKRAEDLLTETKPGDLVTLDPPYAQTKGYAVGNEHGNIGGAVNFIERDVTPAIKRGVSIIYTNSAHIPIVEALRKAGMETRIERVNTQNAGRKGQQYRYEVVGWTKDVSPPRPTDPDVLKGLIAQGSSQQDLSGKTAEELWNTYIRSGTEQRTEAGLQEPKRITPADKARQVIEGERRKLIPEAARILSQQNFSIKGDPVEAGRVLDRALQSANNFRHEYLAKIENATERDALAKEFPEFTAQNIAADVEALTKAPAEPGAPEPEPEKVTGWKPTPGAAVEWQEGGQTRIGKVTDILPNGRYKVKVSGKTEGPRNVRLSADTEFQPHTVEIKARQAKKPPRLDPATDSLEKAIRSLGGIKDDGSGELRTLRESGKPGLVTPDGRSPEAMAQALREHGYLGGLINESGIGSGVDAPAMIDAAVEDATGSRRHYSSEYESPDFAAAEREHYLSQMTADEKAQFEASEKFLNSPRVTKLLQEVANGTATAETYRKINEAGKARGLTADTISEHVNYIKRTAEGPDAAQPGEATGKPEAASTEGRALEPTLDAEGNLRDAAGNVLFARQFGQSKPTEGPLVTRDQTRLTINENALELLQKHGILPASVEGATFTKGRAEIYADQLRQAATANPADGKALRRLARQLTGAANVEQIGPVTMGTPNARIHELSHEASDIASGMKALGEKHTPAGFKTLTTDDPHWKTIDSGLRRLNYDTSDIPTAVEEAYAHLMEGQHEALGLSRAQGDTWLDKWFTSFAEAGGDISPEHFKEMTDESNKVREAAYARESKPGQSSADIRGVETGRQGGDEQADGQGAPRYRGPVEDLTNEPKYLGGKFFSQLYRTLVQKMPGRASVEQIRKIVENPQSGVKAEEIKWSGLDDFLKDRPDATRRQVLDFLRANQLQIAEKTKGQQDAGSEEVEYDAWHDSDLGDKFQRLRDTHGLTATVDPGDPDFLWFTEKSTGDIVNLADIRSDSQRFNHEARRAAISAVDAYADWKNHRQSTETTKYAQYTVPGKAENYREILFTLPRTGDFKLNQSYVTKNGQQVTLPERSFSTMDEAQRVGREEGYPGEPTRVIDSSKSFQSSHWQDTPNVLAHTRVDDRTTANGEKALFVNEAQSDWHQKGRKAGYRAGPITTLPDPYYIKKIAGEYFAMTRTGTEQGPNDLVLSTPTWNGHSSTEEEATRRAIEAVNYHEQHSSPAGARVPPAPFQKNWHEFVMRRMLAEAVERGYDHLAWATGEQSAELYDLSKHIDSIEYKPRASKDGYFISANKDGKQVLRKDVPTGELENLVGKEIAQKIIDGEGAHKWTIKKTLHKRRGVDVWEVLNPNGWNSDARGYDTEKEAERAADGHNEKEVGGTLSGLDLKVGGEGMKGFYDKIIPDYMRRLVKKWGGKVEKVATLKDEKGVNTETARRVLNQIIERAAESENDDLQYSAARILGRVEGVDGPKENFMEALVNEQRYGDAEQAKIIIDEIETEQNKGGQQVWGVRITPEMRESLLADGQPLFKRKPNETENEYDRRIREAKEKLRIPRGPETPATTATQAAPATPRPIIEPLASGAEVATSTPLPPPVRRVPGERSFPKTAERAGHTGGTDRDYTVLTNKESIDTAERRITRIGIGRAQSELQANQEPGAHEGAMGMLLIQRFEKMGDLKRAVEVANDLSRKYTQAGQFVQSASIISRLSPEGVLLAAQKQMKHGRTVPEETAKTLVAQVREVSQAEQMIAKIQAQRPDIFGPNGEILPRTTAREITRDSNAKPVTRRQAKARIGKLSDRLAAMEQNARQRLAERKQAAQPLGPEAGAAYNPFPDLADWAIVGAAKLARSGIDRATWMAEMAQEIGAGNVKAKDLRKLYHESYKEYEAQRQQFLRESRERGAVRQNEAEGLPAPTTRAEYDRIISERLDAMTAARKARTELARTFKDLNATTAKKVMRTAADVWDLSRSVITSVDISAGGRQAKMAAVPRPVTFARGLMRQFKALSTKQYERMISENESDPDYKLAQRFKSDFFTSGATTKGGHEEVYQSGLADKIPWVKHSEQMYNTMLDTVRLGWWKSQLKAMRAEGLDPNNPDHKQLFELQADLISNFNGRGGGKLVRQVSPITNKLAFSTRFWASRLRVLSLPLDPRMYGVGTADHPAFSKATRVDAWKTLIGFYGLTASTLAIAKMTGAQVNITNPDDPDWLKARWGKVHVDFSAGLQSHLRFIARFGKLMYLRQTQPGRQRSAPADIVGHYLRSKEAPNVALIHDWLFSDKKQTPTGLRGTSVIGEPFYPLGEPGKGKMNRVRTSALAQRAIPIVFQDVMDAYQEQIGAKATLAVTAASLFGEGVTTYQPKPSKQSRYRLPAPQRQQRQQASP